ncbi:hypothetical protein RvY_05231 [Ramazzottius varieornatus]|uniref:1-phosphatidylinositol 4,5-bisphosphate phosphodiesterase n=1 Tax=Ramazzottius varieornatus TaxID=947166 RepID=A0A1D1UY09_RAMVA|nr:hypothetical protein RvY_05231 [Ramazzottius varieornatus]
MPMPAVSSYEKSFQRELTLPQALVSGCKALKYEHGALQVLAVTIGVDPNCFFLFYTDQHRKSECLDLASIRDTRIGEKRARLPRDPKLLQLCLIGSERDIPLEEKCMTLVVGSSYVDLRFISFIFAKRAEAHFWTKELFQLAYNFKTYNLSLERTLLKIYTRLKITSAPEVRIAVKDIIQYFYADKDDRRRCEKALEAHKNDPILLENFQFKDFLRLYSQIVPRPGEEKAIEQVFTSLTGSKSVKYLTDEQVKDFLNRTQRDPRLNEILHPHATVEGARKLIVDFEPHESMKTANQLSQDGLMRYLMSAENLIVHPSYFTIHQDMTQPLSSYFINSSHNTYLLGAQIKGKSSAEMYRQALLSGCRCVELDVWDGENDEPIITHGRTLTVPISIKEALDAIADYAFKTSDFPLILSLENRCSARLQDKLGRYLKRAFGPALLDKPLTTHALESGVLLPSPENLKNRILIKNKKRAPTVGPPPNVYKDPAGGDRLTPELEDVMDDSDTDEEAAPDDSPDVELDASVTAVSQSGQMVSSGNPMVETELSALVNYVQPTRLDSFELAKKRNRAYECVSLVEDRAMLLLKKDPVNFIDFNKRQLTRIYPNGTRVKSTNFLPFFYFSSGCQMVALNFQTADLGMQLNTAMFEQNGRSGFLIKPELMRRKDRTLDPFTESPLDGVVPAALTIRILSGLMLSFKRISSFVEVDMYGIVVDIDKKNHRTKSCPNNGMNPQYDQSNQPFSFRVTLPEMAYLRISVREERTSRLIGHCLLPVSKISPGYRHVVLRNEIGQTLPATVFVFVDVKDYVPSFQIDLANALENPISYQLEHHRKEKLDRLLDLTEDLEDQDPAVIEQVEDLRGNGALVTSHSEGDINGDHRPETPILARSPRDPAVVKDPRPSPLERFRSESMSGDRPKPLPGVPPPGTPHVPKRASIVAENSDDRAVQNRLLAVRAPSIEELKQQSKALKKICVKQNKELLKLQSKYDTNVKHLESAYDKEQGRMMVEHNKQRMALEKMISKGSKTERDLDTLLKSHESQRWDLCKKHAETLGALRKELYEKEFDINMGYHEEFYQAMEAEIKLQQIVLTEQLKNASKVNVDEMKNKLSQVAAKEMAELKAQNLDKVQFDQRRDDITQKNIHQAVAIAKKYDAFYEERKKTLAEEVQVLLGRVKRERAHVQQELENKCASKCRSLEEELKEKHLSAQ